MAVNGAFFVLITRVAIDYDATTPNTNVAKVSTSRRRGRDVCSLSANLIRNRARTAWPLDAPRKKWKVPETRVHTETETLAVNQRGLASKTIV